MAVDERQHVLSYWHAVIPARDMPRDAHRHYRSPQPVACSAAVPHSIWEREKARRRCQQTRRISSMWHYYRQASRELVGQHASILAANGRAGELIPFATATRNNTAHIDVANTSASCLRAENACRASARLNASMEWSAAVSSCTYKATHVPLAIAASTWARRCATPSGK